MDSVLACDELISPLYEIFARLAHKFSDYIALRPTDSSRFSLVSLNPINLDQNEALDSIDIPTVDNEMSKRIEKGMAKVPDEGSISSTLSHPCQIVIEEPDQRGLFGNKRSHLPFDQGMDSPEGINGDTKKSKVIYLMCSYFFYLELEAEVANR